MDLHRIEKFIGRYYCDLKTEDFVADAQKA